MEWGGARGRKLQKRPILSEGGNEPRPKGTLSVTQSNPCGEHKAPDRGFYRVVK